MNHFTGLGLRCGSDFPENVAKGGKRAVNIIESQIGCWDMIKHGCLCGFDEVLDISNKFLFAECNRKGAHRRFSFYNTENCLGLGGSIVAHVGSIVAHVGSIVAVVRVVEMIP